MKVSGQLAIDWQAPFQRNNYLFSFTFFSAAAFAGSVSSALFVGAGIWAIISLGTYRFEPVMGRGALALAGIFGFYYFAGALNAAVHWGDRESLLLLIERLPFLAVLPMLARVSLSSRESLLEAVENGALAGIALATPVGIVQLLQSNARPEAFSGNPSVFALAMTLLFVICCIAARRRGGRAEVVFASGATLAALWILAAGTRSFWPMLVIAPAAAFLMVGGSRTPRLLTWRFTAVVLAVLVGAGVLAGDRIGQRIGAMSQELSGDSSGHYGKGSIRTRLAMWRCAATVIVRNPLAGAGVDGSRQAMRDCARADEGRWSALSHFHNFVLDGLAKGGLAELAARLLALIGPPVLIVATVRRSAAAQALKQPLLALTGLTAATFLASGAFGIFLGQDVADALYLYMTIVLCRAARDLDRPEPA